MLQGRWSYTNLLFLEFATACGTVIMLGAAIPGCRTA